MIYDTLYNACTIFVQNLYNICSVQQLSMVEAYILHFVSKINYARNIADLNREIHSQTTQNENMREKSLYYASNPYRKNK